MTIGYSPHSDETPDSISIDMVQSEKKEAHVCILDGCSRGKRGKSNYCREHKAIGRIIEGKIARERANSVDPSMSMYEEALRILSLIHISEPTRHAQISYAVFCLKKKISMY